MLCAAVAWAMCLWRCIVQGEGGILKKIKKRYLVKRPKRPLVCTKRLPNSLKVLYFFGVYTVKLSAFHLPPRFFVGFYATLVAQSELQNDTWRRWREGDERWLTNLGPKRPTRRGSCEKRSWFDWRCFTFTFWSSLRDCFGRFFSGEKFS